MVDVKQVVNGTVNRIADTADQDRAIQDNSHAGHKTTLPPHLENLGINVNAAAEARAKNEQTDRNLSSVPEFRKP